MNDLDLMEKFRSDVAPADSRMLAQARAGMFREQAAAKKSSRWAWRVVPVAGLAAAVAVTAVAIHPHDGASSTPPSAESVRVLRLAAAEARSQPTLRARNDQYVYVQSQVAYASGDGDARHMTYSPAKPTTRRVWLSVDGSRQGLLQETTTSGQRSTTSLAAQTAYRRGLPTDEKGMRAYLYKRGYGGDTRDNEAFTKVGDTLNEEYVPAASVGALFDAATTIPATTVVPQVDMDGRHGIAVTRVEDGIRYELIFDSSTYEFLGVRQVVVDPAKAKPFPAGAVVGYSAQEKIAIVDKAGQLP